MGKYAGGRNPKCDLFEMTWFESQSIKIVALPVSLGIEQKDIE